jgi:organic hydroperoxide reductase OsmC/OhrA
MHPYPHLYSVHAQTVASGDVALTATGLPALATAPPAEFDGPGDRWSPETLLVGAIADCFVLSFRAVARASKLEWDSLEASVEGKLDRADGKTTRFTEFHVHATLRVPAGTNLARATTMLEKAEKVCLISNSLLGERHLHPTVLAG